MLNVNIIGLGGIQGSGLREKVDTVQYILYCNCLTELKDLKNNRAVEFDKVITKAVKHRSSIFCLYHFSHFCNTYDKNKELFELY